MSFRKILMILPILVASVSVNAAENPLPENMLKIMKQEKYLHANWGLYVKDTKTGETLFDLNADKMCLPASTTKLFSVAALLNAYGDNYRFKTPVYSIGKLKDGKFQGNLILVGQGDLTFGGRQNGSDKIAYTKLDHIIANEVPGTILTPQDPLQALNNLAKQIKDKGFKEINGDILIDDRLFETSEARGLVLAPIFINENIFDFVINPTELGKIASVVFRPEVPGYTVTNNVVTVAKDTPQNINLTEDDTGTNIVIEGSIPLDQKDVVRILTIKKPKEFARAAFIQALRSHGITVNIEEKENSLPSQSTFVEKRPIAVWTSPPLSEYAKLILKVSHNLGADLVPLLLAAQKGQTTFAEGMIDLGDFVTKDVLISADTFVFVDAAGGDNNRVTPKAEVQLLEYIRRFPIGQFNNFYNALPILGVDGSLQDFGKNTSGAGKIRAKTGTGVSFNMALNQFFLTTQTMGGFIEGKNGNTFAFMLSVNDGQMPAIKDVFAIFEDLSQISSMIYDLTD